MHYTGLTFRPPYEANSLLLQVTSGCSHNACSFCVMYKDVPYCVSPWEEIESDIEEATYWDPMARRVFLLNGDAFNLPAAFLLELAEKIKAKLPYVCEITGYGRIDAISSKTDDELRALVQAGYCDINIGVESAMDSVLTWMNKGYSAQEAREQLLRAKAAGLTFSLNIINAAAGPECAMEHARANAEFCNQVQPYLIFVSPLHIDPGSRIEASPDMLGFEESTLGEYIQEEIAFLEGLEMEQCAFFGTHVSNPIPVSGLLPRDKEALLARLRKGMERMPQHVLDSHPQKGAEGALR